MMVLRKCRFKLSRRNPQLIHPISSFLRSTIQNQPFSSTAATSLVFSYASSNSVFFFFYRIFIPPVTQKYIRATNVNLTKFTDPNFLTVFLKQNTLHIEIKLTNTAGITIRRKRNVYRGIGQFCHAQARCDSDAEFPRDLVLQFSFQRCRVADYVLEAADVVLCGFQTLA
jgi:hypothetical protein